MERTGPQVHVAPVRCPYCHEGIPRGEPPAVCAECHALHHGACISEHGACAACGKKTSSPDDSKLAAALRARASARVEKQLEPVAAEASSPSLVAVMMALALGASAGMSTGMLVASRLLDVGQTGQLLACIVCGLAGGVLALWVILDRLR